MPIEIKGFWQWLNEAASPPTIETVSSILNSQAVVQADTAAGIYGTAEYKAIIAWWSNGGSTVTRKTNPHALQTDQQMSLASAKYWAGAGTTVTSDSFYLRFNQLVDILVKAATVPGSVLAPVKAFVDQLIVVKRQLEDQKRAGLVLINPGRDLSKMIPTYFTQENRYAERLKVLASGKPPQEYDSYLKTILQSLRTSPETLFQAMKANQALWAPNIKVSDSDKQQMIKDFVSKATKRLADLKKKDPNANQTIDQLIASATDMYFIPASQKILQPVASAPTAPTTITITGNYPELPQSVTENGEILNPASPEMQNLKSFFGDNDAIVNPKIQAGIAALINETIDKIAADTGTITSVKIYGVASTSNVPTKYKATDPNTKSNTENNVTLVNDRVAAITKAFSDSFNNALRAKNLTAQIAIDPTLNVIKPNNTGPAGTDDWLKDADKAKYYSPTGTKTQAYEDKYGKYRFSLGLFELQYTKRSTQETPIETMPTVIGNWKAVIDWHNEDKGIPWRGKWSNDAGGGGGQRKTRIFNALECSPF